MFVFSMSKLKKTKEGKDDCHYGLNTKEGLTLILNIHIYLITFI